MCRPPLAPTVLPISCSSSKTNNLHVMSDVYETGQTPDVERDINEVLDEILLAEDRLHSEGYKKGYAEGCTRGNQEGYKLGFAQGLQLGQELGGIYGTVVAELQLQHTDRLKRTLQQLRKVIDDFPHENDKEADIIGALENIRNLNKRVQAMLGTKKQTEEERKDYSF